MYHVNCLGRDTTAEDCQEQYAEACINYFRKQQRFHQASFRQCSFCNIETKQVSMRILIYNLKYIFNDSN